MDAKNRSDLIEILVHLVLVIGIVSAVAMS